VLRPTYPIRTERLLLRPFAAEDFDDAFEFHSLPEVARYLYWDPPTRAEFADVLALRAARTALEHEGDALSLAVVPHDLGHVVGDMTFFWRSQKHRQGELGFVFHPNYQGRGYAYEASVELLRLGFEDLGLRRIVGRLDGRNEASARLLERLGMRREAHLIENEFVKGEWTDEVIYAVLDREWRS
jgi:RimJ/RimL family protein N-acetyltransferase